MTSDWPEYEIERVAGILLRVELQEQRHRETGAWAALVDHLNRAVSAACLISQEEEAQAYIRRTSEAMRQWVAAVRPLRSVARAGTASRAWRNLPAGRRNTTLRRGWVCHPNL